MRALSKLNSGQKGMKKFFARWTPDGSAAASQPMANGCNEREKWATIWPPCWSQDADDKVEGI